MSVVRACLHPRNEPVRMNALHGANRPGWLEAVRQNGAENLQHRRRLLQAHQLPPQGRTLLGSGFESKTHSRYLWVNYCNFCNLSPVSSLAAIERGPPAVLSMAEPSREILSQPRGAVERGDYLAYPSRVGLLIA